uniref:SECA_MOTOR_DEAD domain-containing protein n=1 Tax=Meloidogyne hapla TaxID=6305 RepID=A0A1I8BUV9_MELHA
MRILIAKKEHSEDDEQCLREEMDKIRKNWTEQWGSGQLDRLRLIEDPGAYKIFKKFFRRFGESEALQEQLERTKQWMEESKEIGDLCCALAYFDEPEFMARNF